MRPETPVLDDEYSADNVSDVGTNAQGRPASDIHDDDSANGATDDEGANGGNDFDDCFEDSTNPDEQRLSAGALTPPSSQDGASLPVASSQELDASQPRRSGRSRERPTSYGERRSYRRRDGHSCSQERQRSREREGRSEEGRSRRRTEPAAGRFAAREHTPCRA